MAKSYSARDMTLGAMSWFIYGHPRVGKTVMIGTFKEPILLTNFANENGAAALRGHPGDVTIYDVETSQDVLDFPVWIVKKNAERAAEGLAPFATVAVDSLTSFLEMRQADLGHALSLPRELPLIAEWTNDIIALIDRLRPLKAEKVYTSTLTVKEDRKTGAISSGPSLFRSLAGRVPAKCDATILLESNSVADGAGGVRVDRMAWMTPHDGLPAGTRGYAGPPIIMSPSYGKIMAELGKSKLFE